MLRRLSLSAKILFLCSIFILPISYLVYNMVTAYNKDIVFGELELKGNRYMRPLVALMEDISLYRLQGERLLSGDAAMRKLMEKTQEAAERHLQDMQLTHNELGNDLQFSDEGLQKRKREHLKLATFQEEWQKLKINSPTMDAKALDDQSQHLIHDLRGMIAQAGDTSNLILDPDLDSYYMMDISLSVLPQMQDRLQQITSFLGEALKKSILDEEDKVQIAIYTAMFSESDLDRVVSDANTALNEDPNFYGRDKNLQKSLPMALNAARAKMDPFVAMLTSLKDKGIGTLGTDEAFAISLGALDQSFRLWAETTDRLDDLIQTRLAAYQQQKNRAFVVSVVSLLIFMTIIFLVTRRIGQRLVKEVVDLKSEAQETQTSSLQLSQCADSLAATGAEQAAAIQETIAAVAEINSMVAQTATQAKTSQEIATSVSDKTGEGGRIMSAMAQSMESIEDANAKLQSISKIIAEISTKTNVINDIVFKTQLLSFNASIEAARAGQHGKGFAVVAEEVGNLAQMSGHAAKEIRALLDDSENQVGRIVEATQARVLEGKSVSQQAQAIFSEIASDILVISGQVQSVSEATQEQKLGIEQISKAMNQMDDTTKANSSGARQTAVLSRGLKTQSQKLTAIAITLDSLIQGQAVKPAQRPKTLGNTGSAGKDHRADEAVVSAQNALAPQAATTTANQEARLALIDALAARMQAPIVVHGVTQENPAKGDGVVTADDPTFRRAG